MTTKMQYTGSGNARRLHSPGLWADCPILEIMAGREDGIYFFDDFIIAAAQGTQTTELFAYGHHPYKVFATTAGQIEHDATFNSVETPGGILATLNDTDGDTCAMAFAYPGPFKMSGVSATSKKLWFEARVAVSSLVTNGIGFMLGLAEADLWTFSTTVPFNAGDAIDNSAAFIGFHYPEDDTTTADTVYSDRDTSFTKVGDGEVTGLAAYTWVKLGFLYDFGETVNTVTFFQDGVRLGTKISAATLTGLTNLDAGMLSPIFSTVADSAGTAITTHLDWWAIAQTW